MQKGYDQIPTQETSDDNDIFSGNQESNDRIPPRVMLDGDDISSEEQEGVEHIPLEYQISYVEVCLFEETGDILLFNMRSYKVSISIGFMANKMHSVNHVLDTGARPSPILEVFLRAKWLKSIQANSRFSLRTVISQKISVVETISIFVTASEPRVREVFGVVRDIAIPVLQRISFTDRFLKGIFRPEQNIVPCNFKPVPILAINNVLEEHKDKDDNS